MYSQYAAPFYFISPLGGGNIFSMVIPLTGSGITLKRRPLPVRFAPPLGEISSLQPISLIDVFYKLNINLNIYIYITCIAHSKAVKQGKALSNYVVFLL